MKAPDVGPADRPLQAAPALGEEQAATNRRDVRVEHGNGAAAVCRPNHGSILRPTTLKAMGQHTALPDAAQHRLDDGAAFENCEHIVRDDDPDTALCGVDQTDVPWNQGLPVCHACLAVAEGRMS